MAKKQKEIKVKVQYTEGYEKRYTEACLEQLRKRNLAEQRKVPSQGEIDAGDEEAIA